MAMRAYKVLNPDRMCRYAGGQQWPKPGEWWKVEGALIPCIKGLHLCRRKDLVGWLGPEIWEAEYSGRSVTTQERIVVRRARLVRRLSTWNERTARLFAADCAERVLPLFYAYDLDDRPRKLIDRLLAANCAERVRPLFYAYLRDDRPRKLIETVRAYARGETTYAEMHAATLAAVAAAAEDDARFNATVDAARYNATARARDAVHAAAMPNAMNATTAAKDATYAATFAAAFAAGPAAGPAAYAAERAWQTEWLFWYLYP